VLLPPPLLLRVAWFLTHRLAPWLAPNPPTHTKPIHTHTHTHITTTKPQTQVNYEEFVRMMCAK